MNGEQSETLIWCVIYIYMYEYTIEGHMPLLLLAWFILHYVEKAEPGYNQFNVLGDGIRKVDKVR